MVNQNILNLQSFWLSWIISAFLSSSSSFLRSGLSTGSSDESLALLRSTGSAFPATAAVALASTLPLLLLFLLCVVMLTVWDIWDDELCDIVVDLVLGGTGTWPEAPVDLLERVLPLSLVATAAAGALWLVIGEKFSLTAFGTCPIVVRSFPRPLPLLVVGVVDDLWFVRIGSNVSCSKTSSRFTSGTLALPWSKKTCRRCC